MERARPRVQDRAAACSRLSILRALRRAEEPAKVAPIDGGQGGACSTTEAGDHQPSHLRELRWQSDVQGCGLCACWAAAGRYADSGLRGCREVQPSG